MHIQHKSKMAMLSKIQPPSTKVDSPTTSGGSLIPSHIARNRSNRSKNSMAAHDNSIVSG
jgi:hypothetical protein